MKRKYRGPQRIAEIREEITAALESTDRFDVLCAYNNLKELGTNLDLLKKLGERLDSLYSEQVLSRYRRKQTKPTSRPEQRTRAENMCMDCGCVCATRLCVPCNLAQTRAFQLRQERKRQLELQRQQSPKKEEKKKEEE